MAPIGVPSRSMRHADDAPEVAGPLRSRAGSILGIGRDIEDMDRPPFERAPADDGAAAGRISMLR